MKYVELPAFDEVTSGAQTGQVGLLKKSASSVLGSLSGFALTDLALFAPFALTYSVYAPGAKAPAVLPEEKCVLAHMGWAGETAGLFEQALC